MAYLIICLKCLFIIYNVNAVLVLVCTLLLTILISVLLTMYCTSRPQKNTWNYKSVKFVNKPFKPKTNHVIRRRRIVRRPRVLDSSTSSGNEPSTSMRPNRDPESHAQYSRPTSGSPSPSPAYHPWRESDVNDSHHSRSDNESPPPPYELLRRSSTSSRSSAQTVHMGAESEERQMLFREESDSE